MPTIPFQNFAFTDPVAAQQAVQMGQLMSLAQAEKDRNASNITQEAIRQRTAQQNAARQQALTEAQMRQQISEAERNRQARAAETSQVLSSQEKVAGLQLQGRNDFRAENEKFNSLASLVESEDPPTDLEFEQLTQGLTGDRKLILRRALEGTRKALKAVADEAQQLADFWNPRFKVLPGSAEHNKAKEAFAKDRRAQELIIQDPRTMEFVPKYKGPRIDAPLPPPPPPGITPIEDLLGRRSPVQSTMPSRGSLMQRPIAIPGGLIMDEPPAPMIDPYSQPAFSVPMTMY